MALGALPLVGLIRTLHGEILLSGTEPLLKQSSSQIVGVRTLRCQFQHGVFMTNLARARNTPSVQCDTLPDDLSHFPLARGVVRGHENSRKRNVTNHTEGNVTNHPEGKVVQGATNRERLAGLQ